MNNHDRANTRSHTPIQTHTYTPHMHYYTFPHCRCTHTKSHPGQHACFTRPTGNESSPQLVRQPPKTVVPNPATMTTTGCPTPLRPCPPHWHYKPPFPHPLFNPAPRNYRPNRRAPPANVAHAEPRGGPHPTPHWGRGAVVLPSKIWQLPPPTPCVLRGMPTYGYMNWAQTSPTSLSGSAASSHL